MSFLRKTIFCGSLFSSLYLLGDDHQPTTHQHCHKQSAFHAIVASGYAWSMDADIRSIDYNFWAASLEGYDASLGASPFIMLGVGYRLFDMLDIDFDYTLYDTFYYQKNQTDPFGNKRTRLFDLDHQGSIFNFSLFPYAFHLCRLELTPFLGLGLGVGTSTVSHFQTVFYDPSQGIGLTTSIGSSHLRNSFAWQGMGGLRIHPKYSRLSLDLAYRYYNGGTFETPSHITNYNGIDQGDLEKGKPWRGTLQTNQLYFALNFTL